MVYYKREIPLILATCTGLLMIFEYFLAVPPSVTILAKEVRNMASFLTVFALGMGAATIYKMHGIKIVRKDKDMYWSALTLAFLTITILVGVIGGTKGDNFLWLYYYIQIPAGEMVKAFRAFFVASASYRLFRARNLESTVLLSFAIIILFQKAPFGVVLFPPVMDIANWVMDTLNTAGARGIMIGTTLGIIALGIRVFLGKERGFVTEAGGVE